MFDILVCHGPHDNSILDLNIQYNSINVVGKKNIYVITHDRNLKRDDCIIVHESVFPFSVTDIKKATSEKRYGWYLQQLLKLYAHAVITNLSEHYLVIDCDTIFLKPTVFFENEIPLYNYSHENHSVYFDHLRRINPCLTKQIKESGICHHMMFSKNILKELFAFVESNYNQQFGVNYSFWEIMISEIDPNHINFSGYSEYELYFNYILQFHRDKMKIRELAWKNSNTLDLTCNNLNYISCHHYNRH